MAITPLSSATSYCPASEALKRVDLRLVADLCSDTGTAIVSGDLATNDNFLAALLDASGDLEAACLLGGKYTPTDLAALTGAAQGRLYRLVTRLTVCYLYERRSDLGPIPDVYKTAEEQLDQLRNGQRIFGTQEHADAGRPDHNVEGNSQVEARQGVAVQASDYFGTRTNRSVV